MEKVCIDLMYGKIVVESLGDGAVRFTDFGIHEEYRGQGVAKMTVNNLTEVWNKVKCETVFNETMEHILADCGFKIEKEEKGVKYWVWNKI